MNAALMGLVGLAKSAEGRVTFFRGNLPYTGYRGQRAVALNGFIYVFGGVNNSTQVGTHYQYDPATDTFTAKANMSAFGNSAAWTDGSYVFQHGGHNYGSTATGNLLQYDPISNLTTAKTAGNARSCHVAGHINGKAYATSGSTNAGYGGSTTSTFEIDTATGTYTNKLAAPAGRFAVGGAVIGNDLYVVGGRDVTNTVSTMVAAYNGVSNTWATKAAQDVGGAFPSAVNVADKMVVGYGTNAAGNCYEYDPGTNTWRTFDVQRLLLGRTEVAMAAVGFAVYAFGGWIQSSNQYRAETEVYYVKTPKDVAIEILEGAIAALT